ncbi:MAG: FecR domain-containing protein [Leptolyngbya sp. SIO1E4]|nr:FecR domain-containing protein [Leptolyngbya sp. SIO1E4]
MSRYHFRWVGLASLLYAWMSALAPTPANAQVPLTRANVEFLQNYVELLPGDGGARPARLTDWLSLDDTIRTASSARADLRFNDGSLARIGEQATFRFIPNTRTFRLSNGTALFLVPPGQGNSIIETPNAITDIQGTALVVRYSPMVDDGIDNPFLAEQRGGEAQGRTVVMVLTDNADDPVKVSLLDGRAADLSAGQMAVIDRDEFYVFEFDLALFYETSALVDGLFLDDPNYLGPGQPTDPIRQGTLEGLVNQRNFVGEYFLNPNFVSSEGSSTATDNNWLVPVPASGNTTSTPESNVNPEPNTAVTPSGSATPEATSDLVPAEAEALPASEVAVPGGASTVNSNILPPGLIQPPLNPPTVTTITPEAPSVPVTGEAPAPPVDNPPPAEAEPPVDNALPADNVPPVDNAPPVDGNQPPPGAANQPPGPEAP